MKMKFVHIGNMMLLKNNHFSSFTKRSWLQGKQLGVKETDMNYMNNCVFADDVAFHITLKRSMAW
ncbi:hypothetical protein RO3G_00975 [Rhizopus delemar RA 99-880]|uniref:Uncharacterized protein n=1 Tax=Rhizopus delemar (strain RA 99-880 / ATCC MYA-4621 / FGSC 9543 / NRRL 43880) TaxID=246409 RepID=I1BJ91_RHIO9|nr:hypothetical protein RO3G_00975 [Rhizopus delemar RA 99-880]|eukprot:EIE76271.1 hypothetical protein RO3G_00975 [Rhizopus delemar RA 99-880]